MKLQDKIVEARLERSLRAQVRAPRLDGGFDAAVWSRIAAEERKAPALKRRSSTPKWLVACNVIGVAVTVALVAVCTVQTSGVWQTEASEVAAALPIVELPDSASLLAYASPVITTIALGFGLVRTRFGRRLFSALR